MKGTADPWRWARGVLLGLVGVWGVVVASATGHPLAGMALVAATVLVLTFSPRVPLLALAAVFVGLFLWGSYVEDRVDDPFIAMLVLASYGVGRHERLTRQPWAAAGVLVLMATNVTEHGRSVVVADVVFPVVLTAGPWLLGLVVQMAARRERAAVDHARRVDEAREEDVRRATSEERLRIARELHDEVAHSISALSLQAQVLRRGLAAGGEVGVEDLRTIETSAQQAMTDLRRLLGLLRPDDEAPLEPQRGLDDVELLVTEARAAGQRVRLRREGEVRPVAPVLGAAAYRIVQEGLTNARRHGIGPADLVLTRTPDDLVIEISNAAPDAQPAAGHGTRGMRERVDLFGGRLDCGPEDGRWVLRAVLPAPTREVVS